MEITSGKVYMDCRGLVSVALFVSSECQICFTNVTEMVCNCCKHKHVCASCVASDFVVRGICPFCRQAPPIYTGLEKRQEMLCVTRSQAEKLRDTTITEEEFDDLALKSQRYQEATKKSPTPSIKLPAGTKIGELSSYYPALFDNLKVTATIISEIERQSVIKDEVIKDKDAQISRLEKSLQEKNEKLLHIETCLKKRQERDEEEEEARKKLKETNEKLEIDIMNLRREIEGSNRIRKNFAAKLKQMAERFSETE